MSTRTMDDHQVLEELGDLIRPLTDEEAAAVIRIVRGTLHIHELELIAKLHRAEADRRHAFERDWYPVGW